MKKFHAMICLDALAILGSYVVFYTSNLVLSDVSNMFYGVNDVNFISSIPGFLFACEMILGTLFVFRLYSHPQYKNAMITLYSKILIGLSAVAAAACIYSKNFIYKDCDDIYPFRGYLTMGMLVHLAFIALGIFLIIFCKKSLPADTDKRRVTLRYRLYTVLLCGLIFFAYNRFGALLWMGVYAQKSTLYLTFPFYISLALPMATLFQYALFTFGAYDTHPRLETTYMVSILVANAVLAIVVCTVGANNTQFVSAISPALAIERLATMPIDTILHFVFVFIFGFYNLFNSLRYRKKKAKKAAEKAASAK